MRLAIASTMVFATLFGTRASAQDVPTERFNSETFAPAPGPGNYLQVEGANVTGHLDFGAGLTLDYAHEPFVLYDATCTDPEATDCQVDGVNTELTSYIAQANLYASFVFSPADLNKLSTS